MTADILEPATAAKSLLQLDPRDDVAVALRAIERGERLDAGDMIIEARQAIPYGHKIALRPLARGDEVRKFGWPIGAARGDIAAGDHVHDHNLSTLLSGVEGYRYEPVGEEPLGPPSHARFAGYRRADGRVGTRNEI